MVWSKHPEIDAPPEEVEQDIKDDLKYDSSLSNEDISTVDRNFRHYYHKIHNIAEEYQEGRKSELPMTAATTVGEKVVEEIDDFELIMIDISEEDDRGEVKRYIGMRALRNGRGRMLSRALLFKDRAVEKAVEAPSQLGSKVKSILSD